MVHEIEYIDSESILVRRVRGRAEFTEIYNSWNDLIKNRKVKPALKGIINDFYEAELIMTLSDVKRLIKLFQEHPDIFNGIKIAVIIDSYKNIVFPMFGQKIVSNMEVRPFSTFEAAYNWIKGTVV